jgi:hypothetical protein
MKNARWLGLCAAAVSIGLLISLLIRPEEEAPSPRATYQAGVARNSQEPAANPAPLTAQVTGSDAQKAFERTRTRFRSSMAYAAFIQDAMQRPDEGGRFYALLAYRRCREAAAIPAGAVLDGRPEAIAVAQQTFGALKQRCNGVLDQFPNERDLIAALMHSNARNPDALLIERGSVKPSTKEQSRNDIRRAFDTHDPYLIAATLDANIDFIADHLGPEFSNGREQALLYLAMAGARCEIIGECQDNYLLALSCAGGEKCIHTNFDDYVRHGVPAESRSLYDRTRARIIDLARGTQPFISQEN